MFPGFSRVGRNWVEFGQGFGATGTIRSRPPIEEQRRPHTINDHAGYAMIFETHVYAFGYEALAAEIRTSFDMPTDCPRAIPASIVDRFDTWIAEQEA
jgi:hypothetical protein